jgi:hypothetical protein
MFSFFHRKPKIVVDCFTSSAFAYDNTPVRKTSKHLPTWWRQLPVFKSGNDQFVDVPAKNMRNCVGFSELFKRGVVLETWAEFKLQIQQEGIAWETSGINVPSVESNDSSTWNHAYKDYHHLKLNPPWVFREKTGIKFMFSEATWLLNSHPFTVLPGIVEYRLNHATGINIFIRKGDYNIFLPVGLPLVQIVPLIEDDREIEYKNHLVSTEEFNNIFSSGPISLFGGYRSLRKLVKRNDEQNGTLCPYREK